MSTITIETRVNVDVEVDVDLDDIPDADIVAHLERNGYRVIDMSESSSPHQEMFRALSMGDKDKAIDLLRDYLCDELGRVI
ncbi:MAG: hypothetical protein ACTJHW_15740 [Paenalcaligenes sp.]